MPFEVNNNVREVQAKCGEGSTASVSNHGSVEFFMHHLFCACVANCSGSTPRHNPLAAASRGSSHRSMACAN